MATGAESRKHERFNLPMQVKVRVKEQAAPELEASARDISATGLYFTVSQSFEAGSELEFELVFPPGMVAGMPPRVRCTGQIVRVDRGIPGERVGVAATISAYHWIRGSAGSATKGAKA
jgi:hypothetical protein